MYMYIYIHLWMYICICMCMYVCKCTCVIYIYMLDTYRRNDDARRKTSLNKIFTSHFICKGTKGLFKVCGWEGAGDRTELKYFDPKLMAVTLCLSCSSDAQPEPWGPLCWVLAFFIHLLSIFSGPQFIRASRGPLRPGVALTTTSRLQLRPIFNSAGRRTQLSYIIVRRPLDLWNRMFNRHQAEITVMQFRGHSLPVHHSVVA